MAGLGDAAAPMTKLMAGSAVRSEPKVVDTSSGQEASQDETKLRHLLAAMKSHQLRRYRPRHATQGRRAIAAEQSEAAENERPFCAAVANPKKLPDRRAAKIVILLP